MLDKSKSYVGSVVKVVDSVYVEVNGTETTILEQEVNDMNDIVFALDIPHPEDNNTKLWVNESEIIFVKHDIMKPTTLSDIKKRIRLFVGLYREVVSCFTEIPHYVTIDVILNNMAFDSSNCVNSTPSDSIDRLYKGKDALEALSKYYNSHVEQWVYSEISMIIDGYVMSEDFKK